MRDKLTVFIQRILYRMGEREREREREKDTACVCDFHCITVSQGNLHYDLPKVVVDQKLGKLQSN